MLASPRKHPQKDKPTTQEKGKVINLELVEEVEEIPMDDEDIAMETEDVEVEGSEPISKLSEYIPLHRGEMKVPKDIDESKVTLHTPLLPEQIVFEGSHLGHVPL